MQQRLPLGVPATEAIDPTRDYQDILEAVAAALHLEVTLVDADLVRIAGTGQHRLRIGEKVHPDSAFARALRLGEGVLVSNPRSDAICQDCGARSWCQEAAHLATPIMDGGRATGVLGLVAFDPAQRERLLHGLDGYREFLDKISRLIASKQKEAAAMRALSEAQERLRAMADSVAEGLIAFDGTGAVTFLSDPARRILGLPVGSHLANASDLPGLEAALAEVLAGGHGIEGRELTLQTPRGPVLVVGSLQPIRLGGLVAGAVASIRDSGAVWKLVYRMHEEKPAWSFEQIIFRSPAMAGLVERARRVAAGQAAVLILGESGTGKELLARAIHAASPRRAGPFVAINCAAIPEELLESELFGYVDGAFTGARRGGKPGKFELAQGGTLLLDEIGDMPLRLQAKLLRILQEAEVYRVGATRGIRLDVRIMAATHQDLEALMSRREFREDLYFRLSVLPLEIPALRQRREDIALLLEHFQALHDRLLGKPVTFAPAVEAVLLHYPWPGNVRELANAVEYAVTMSDGPVAGPECLPARLRGWASTEGAGVDTRERIARLADLERAELERGLALYGTGEKAVIRIAAELGLSRATVYRRLRKHGLLSG